MYFCYEKHILLSHGLCEKNKIIMFTVLEIANYFIKKAKDSNVELTPIKLIKLVFIAQGTSLVLNNRVLFKEPVEAWKYDPVIPELYQTFKNYGNQNILSYAGHSSILADGSIQSVLPKDGKVCELLDEVWAYEICI